MKSQQVIDVGDAREVGKRIKQHLTGNVEASALRKHVAAAIGYDIRSTRRPNGSYRRRLDLPDPKQGKRELSDYIASGLWRCAVCDSYEEAHDLQWFLIERLNPVLNIEVRSWEPSLKERYEELLSELLQSEPALPEYAYFMSAGMGVYVLYHQLLPHEHSL